MSLLFLVIFVTMIRASCSFSGLTSSKICNGYRKVQFKGPHNNGFSLIGTKLLLTTNIFIVGKRNGGEEWIQSGSQEYEKRLSPVMDIETTFLKSDDDLVKISRYLKGTVFALDEHGKQYSSVEFADVLYEKGFREGGSRVNFLIGGFAGLPVEIKEKFNLVSLSKMTWTHQMARLLLIEQIYRASEIRKGSGYHKE